MSSASAAKFFIKSAAKAALGRGMGLRDLSECAAFYRTLYGHNRLFASMMRGGTNYFALLFRLAKELSDGGPGDYAYRDERWATNYDCFTAFDFRTPLNRSRLNRDQLKSGTVRAVYLTHYPVSELEFSKNKIARIKTVVQARNLIDQMWSSLFYHGYSAPRQDEYVRSKFADYPIQFCNEWGDLLENNPGNFMLLKYEDLCDDPVAAAKSFSDFFGFDLKDDAIREAARRTSKEEMKKRIPEQKQEITSRVSFREKGQFFSDANLDYLKAKIKAELRHDFRYDY